MGNAAALNTSRDRSQKAEKGHVLSTSSSRGSLSENASVDMGGRDRSQDKVSSRSGDQVSGQSGDQVSGQSRDQVSGQSQDLVIGQSRDQVSGQSRDQVSGQSRDQVSGQSRDQVSGQSRDHISRQSRDQISRPWQDTSEIRMGKKTKETTSLAFETSALSDEDPVHLFTTASLTHSLNIYRKTDERPCVFIGLVLLQDKVIVCDSHNYKLKVFDSEFTFLYEYKCDDPPLDADVLDNSTIVVSSVEGRCMSLISVHDDGMEENIKIGTYYRCAGVVCDNGMIYCVVIDEIGSEDVSQVRVYTPDGELKRRFEYLSDGKVEFKNLEYITINPQTGILYVTDWDKGVVSMTTSGDVLDVMSPPQLHGPQGIAVDDHGQIYVCGVNSHNVIQMSADGNNVMEILSNNPRCRYAQCVKIYGNRMFIGCRHSNIISVYELT